MRLQRYSLYKEKEEDYNLGKIEERGCGQFQSMNGDENEAVVKP